MVNLESDGTLSCRQKRKTNYASLIRTGSCQFLLRWRRLSRPPAPHRRGGSLASPLTVEPFGRRRHQTCDSARDAVMIMKSWFSAEAISKGGRSETNEPPNGRLGVSSGHPRGGRPSWVGYSGRAQSGRHPVRGCDESAFMKSQLG